jgi:excisionase family DNA binding protein
MIEPRVLRAKDAARYLGVGVKQLRKWVAEGQLPAMTGATHHSPWRFDVRDLEQFLQKSKHTVRH